MLRLENTYHNRLSEFYIFRQRVDYIYIDTMSGVYRLCCRVDYKYYCRMKRVYLLNCREYIVHIMVQWLVLKDNY